MKSALLAAFLAIASPAAAQEMPGMDHEHMDHEHMDMPGMDMSQPMAGKQFGLLPTSNTGGLGHLVAAGRLAQ